MYGQLLEKRLDSGPLANGIGINGSLGTPSNAVLDVCQQLADAPSARLGLVSELRVACQVHRPHDGNNHALRRENIDLASGLHVVESELFGDLIGLQISTDALVDQ